MALESGIGEARSDRLSHDRESSSLDRRPAVGIRASVALGRALDLQLGDGAGDRGRRRSPLARLRALTELRAVLEQLEEIDVEQALRAGFRWEDIGQALGSSRSAAHRKYGELHRGRSPGSRW